MRAAIYCRISHDPTGKSAGVERQLQDCQTLCHQQHWDIQGVYTDNDISAYTGKRRPQYEAMLQAVQAGEVDAIVAWHSDRLHRSIMDLERFIEIVDTHKTQVRTVTSGTMDLSTSAGRMVARILGATARQESEHKGERVARAYEQKAASGEWHRSKSVFGWNPDGTHNPTEAKAIRDGVAAMLSGGTFRGLAREWAAQGLVGRMGKPFTGTAVKDVLLNPRHSGMVVHRTKVVGKGQWEPIIDRDDQLALQALASDPGRRNNMSFERLYQGTKVYECGLCGGRMIAHRTKKRSVYMCEESRHVVRVQDAVDELVDEVMVSFLDSQTVERAHQDDRPLVSRRDGLQARLQELAGLYATGDIDANQLRTGTESLREQIRVLDVEIAEGRGGLVFPAGDEWKSLSPDLRGKIIAGLLRVIIDPQPVGRQPGGGYFNPEYIRFVWL